MLNAIQEGRMSLGFVFWVIFVGAYVVSFYVFGMALPYVYNISLNLGNIVAIILTVGQAIFGLYLIFAIWLVARRDRKESGDWIMPFLATLCVLSTVFSYTSNIFMTAPYYGYLRLSPDYGVLQSLSSAANDTPLKLNDTLSIDSVYFDEENNKALFMLIWQLNNDQLSEDEKAEMWLRAVSYHCNQPDELTLYSWKSSITIDYDYYTKDGQKLFTIDSSQKSCESLKADPDLQDLFS